MDVILSTILKNSHYSKRSNRQTEYEHDNNLMASNNMVHSMTFKGCLKLKSTTLANNTFKKSFSDCGSYVF